VIRQKLLGTAFASADLLFEVDGAGVITFAIGSARGTPFSDATELLGRPWTALFRPKDKEALAAILRGTRTGERRGPMPMGLAPVDGQACPASLSVFRLPERADESLSCSITLRGQSDSEDAAELVPAE
jgi:hypothetical protein